MDNFFAIFCAAIVAFCLKGHVSAIQVAFDNNHDITKVSNMNCEYSDDYQDFWAYGCERNPSEDVYPAREGYWTGCNRHCALIYHGGSLPKPAKLLVETYIEGDAYIGISGKNDPKDSEFEHDFGRIESRYSQWCYKEIDLADYPLANASVINFNISSLTKGFILIDKIFVDLGDKQIDNITLESKNDELPEHWSYDDCHHLEDYADFWAFGCPVDPVEENPNTAIGFWSPCTLASCKIEFATSPSIIPSALTIRGYVEGAAQISVRYPSGSNNSEYVVIATISAKEEGEWVDMDVDLSSYRAYKIDVVLESNGGTALVDSLSYSFDNAEEYGRKQSELPECNQDPPTTPPAPTTPETEATIPTTISTTVPPTSTTTAAGSVLFPFASVLLLLAGIVTTFAVSA